jgi:hypothetical protein
MSISVTQRGGAFTARGGWNVKTVYFQDDFVIWGTTEYQSLLPVNAGNQPDTSPWAWLPQAGSVAPPIDYGIHVFNVHAYGATGDGTHDDYPAITAAIAAASAANGGIVYFPSGTYNCASGTPTLLDHVQLLGENLSSTTILQPSTTRNGISGNQLTSVGIEDLTIQGPGSGSGTGVRFTRQTTPTLGINYRVTMRRVMVVGFGGDGIHIDQCIVSSFEVVECRSCLGHGFNFNGIDPGDGASGTSVQFTACYANACAQAGFRLHTMTYCALDSCAADTCGVGYLIDTAGAITLNGCGCEALVNTSPTYPGDGIQINVCSGVVANACFLYDVVRHGILVTGSRGIVLNGVREFHDIGGGGNSFIFQSSTGTVIGLTFTLPVDFSGGGSSFVTQLDIQGTAGGYKFPSPTGLVDAQVTNPTDPALAARVIGDNQARFYVDASGAHNWGPGGSSVTDTLLQRVSSNKLQTAAMVVVGQLGVGNAVGAVGPVGAIAYKIPIMGVAGTPIGFIPVYSTIT